MKRHEQSLREFLDHSFARFRKLPPEQVESACDRVLERLRGNVEGASEFVPVAANSAHPVWRLPRLAVATLAVLVLLSIPIVRTFVSPENVFAIVVTVDGSVDKVADGESHSVSAGEKIDSGKILRTNDGAGLVFDLADGSRVEMSSSSEVELQTAEDGVRLQLNSGSIIVTTAKLRNGHLYVRTKDVIVSVVDTVFFVNAEAAGARVAVIQGEAEIQVAQQGATWKGLLAGEQMATNPNMELRPVSEQISWSRSAPSLLALLQQSVAVPRAAVPKRLEFEAASIRPLDPNVSVEVSALKCRGIDGVWSTSARNAPALDVPQGRCSGVFSLSGPVGLIAALYDVPFDRVYSDIDSLFAGYRLEAKAEDPASATKEQLRQMLENLVIDRFKLKFHRETKGTVKGYALFAGNGVKFKEASVDEESFSQSFRPKQCCIVIKGNLSLKRFADTLGMFWTGDGPVLDKTDLRGIYELQLTLNALPELPRTDSGDGVRGAGENSSGKPPKAYDPPLAKAIEDQLGLRLEYGYPVPIEYLVIDHAEKPSEN